VAAVISALLAELLPWAIGIFATLGAIFGISWSKERTGRKQGRQETYIEAKARDHEKASEIRDRVERDLPDRVREYDDAGYRD
jgi:hypothetical protein